MPNELELRKEQLPATISELRKFILITRERINVHKAQISAIKRIGLSKTVYDQKLKEAQFMGKAVLWAEVKMGKLLLKDTRLYRGGDQKSKDKKKSFLKEAKIQIMESKKAQALAKYEEVVEDSVEEDIRKEKIPTRESALRKIREVKVQRVREAMKRKGNVYKEDKDLPIVVHSDFYEYCMSEIKPGSISHIVTDPPYPHEFLPLWSQLSEVANRVLKPSGFCICYTGVYWLSEVLERMEEHLRYYWQLCLRMTGAHARVHPRNIYQAYRSILVFQKEPVKKQRFMVTDFISEGGGRDKELHKWQQSLNGFLEVLDRFTFPHNLILDPFGGSGTTGIACMKKNRRCILIEKEMDNIKIMRARLKDTLKEIRIERKS